MKTVLIAFYNSYPPTFGSASVTYNMSKYLSGEKYLFHLGDSEDGIIDGMINLVNIKNVPSNRLLKMIRLLVSIPSIAKKIAALKPDYVILENASWAVYYLIFLKFLKAQGKDLKIIYHAHCVEYQLRKEKNGIILALITQWAERILLKQSDKVYSVSEADAENFRLIYGVSPEILPNCVDTDKFNLIGEDQIASMRGKYNLNGRLLLFMGLPEFKPNKDAINLLINRILPSIVEEFPDCKLAVIGGKIGYKRPWLINPGNIPFDEVPAFIKACEVCLAPIFSGSGVRLKILEYMAAAKPVVSSKKGAEGITAEKERDILFAENPEEFSEKTVYLLRNPDVANKIAISAARIIEEKYSWKKVMRVFNKALSAEH